MKDLINSYVGIILQLNADPELFKMALGYWIGGYVVIIVSTFIGNTIEDAFEYTLLEWTKVPFMFIACFVAFAWFVAIPAIFFSGIHYLVVYIATTTPPA